MYLSWILWFTRFTPPPPIWRSCVPRASLLVHGPDLGANSGAPGDGSKQGERAMARETTVAGKLGKLGGLQQLRGALKTNSGLLQHLEASLTQFDGMVGKAQELTSRQGALTAEKQETTKQLRETLIEAQR